MSGESHSESETVPTISLKYSISGCSEHSGKYVAQNILIDSPLDQLSRWSGAHPSPNLTQWILLKLDTLSVLKSISFGKFHKAHPCNMKEFKLYVGETSDNMTEVLHSGLKNDSVPETFSVKHVNNAGVCFPTRYIKIVPLSAHGQSFHTSIWHVALSGISDESYLEQVQSKFNELRETAMLRHVLKDLRQRRLLTPYRSILSRSGLQIEHPLISELHDSIVLEGSWERAERILRRAGSAGLFASFLRASQPRAEWTRLHGVDADGDAPPARGGHAMCLDSAGGKLYLFGGWDGRRSLDDFWVYDTKAGNWTVLSHSTAAETNGPGPRACHKMVFDKKSGSIYVLGRLIDADEAHSRADVTPTGSGAPPVPAQTAGTAEGTSNALVPAHCSEFFRYHTRGLDAGKWDLLSFDTTIGGGPPLIFDHQMVIDSDAQVIYVFGGRVVDGDWDTLKYSGLYSYNIRLSKWKLLQPDTANVSQSIIPPRFGHSMLLEPNLNALIIFAGQRDEKYLSDMHIYDIATNTATELFSNFTIVGGPTACFTQRAVIDPALREIYVFCGLTRVTRGGAPTVQSSIPNWVYRYDTRPGTWAKMLPATDPTSREPEPRYAHQAVYDPSTQTTYLHGGNAGVGTRFEGPEGERRLDDFWSLKLARPEPEEIVRRGTYHIRKQQFKEMCEEVAPVKALDFLQTEVYKVVDHDNSEEANEFHSLLAHLLTPKVLTPAVITRGAHDEAPPRKRSRSNTPTGTKDGSAEGTARPSLDVDIRRGSRLLSVESLREKEDDEERKIRGEGAGTLSGTRFTQRTAVFEALLEYFPKEEKQPEGSLMDLVNVEWGG